MAQLSLMMFQRTARTCAVETAMDVSLLLSEVRCGASASRRKSLPLSQNASVCEHFVTTVAWTLCHRALALRVGLSVA